jgi:hypothetical protein
VCFPTLADALSFLFHAGGCTQSLRQTLAKSKHFNTNESVKDYRVRLHGNFRNCDIELIFCNPVKTLADFGNSSSQKV